MKSKLFEERLKRAIKVAWILQLVPFIRMIGLNGSMTRGNITEKSDIDFLIIAKKGRIWTCRFFTVLLTHLTGQRRYGQKIAGRICLNCYQTDNFLEIRPSNFYTAACYSFLTPLFDTGLYPKYQKSNKWMEKFNFKVKPTRRVNLINNSFLGFLRKINEIFLSGFFGDWLEKKLGDYQKKRILKDPRTLIAPKGRIKVSEKEIRLHPLKE